MAPSPELIPGGSWERPWVAGEDGDVLERRTRPAASTRPSRAGEVGDVELDGVARTGRRVDGAGLYDLVEHPRHESHGLTLRPSPGLRVWSLSFAAGVP